MKALNGRVNFASAPKQETTGDRSTEPVPLKIGTSVYRKLEDSTDRLSAPGLPLLYMSNDGLTASLTLTYCTMMRCCPPTLPKLP